MTSWIKIKNRNQHIRYKSNFTSPHHPPPYGTKLPKLNPCNISKILQRNHGGNKINKDFMKEGQKRYITLLSKVLSINITIVFIFSNSCTSSCLRKNRTVWEMNTHCRDNIVKQFQIKIKKFMTSHLLIQRIIASQNI